MTYLDPVAIAQTLTIITAVSVYTKMQVTALEKRFLRELAINREMSSKEIASMHAFSELERAEMNRRFHELSMVVQEVKANCVYVNFCEERRKQEDKLFDSIHKNLSELNQKIDTLILKRSTDKK